MSQLEHRFVKICKVCGDRASGFNYAGLSCKPCKVFFYRNSYRYERFKCRGKGGKERCPISSKANRKQCTKCRLDRCLEIGMRRRPKELNKIEAENVKTEDKMPEKLEVVSNSSILDSRIVLNLNEINDGNEFARQDEEESRIPDLFINKKAPSYQLELTEYERAQVDLIQASYAIFPPENHARIVRPVKDVFEAINIPGIYFQRIIKLIKTIPGYSWLSPEEQFEIFKPFCFEMTEIRYAFVYDPATNGFPMIENEEGTHAVYCCFDGTKAYFKSHDLVDEIPRFWSRLQVELECDHVIRNLVTTGLLFKPRGKAASSECVRYYYILYSHLLRRYLEAKYRSIRRADAKLETLLSLVNELQDLKQKEIQLFHELDRGRISHTIEEMYAMI